MMQARLRLQKSDVCRTSSDKEGLCPRCSQARDTVAWPRCCQAKSANAMKSGSLQGFWALTSQHAFVHPCILHRFPERMFNGDRLRLDP